MTEPHYTSPTYPGYVSQKLFRHLKRVSAEQLYHTDPQFKANISMLRIFIGQVVSAMDDAHCTLGQIEEVVDKLLYGIVSPGEAMRIEQQHIISSELDRALQDITSRPLFPTAKEHPLDQTQERPGGQATTGY
jgi:hypothetical protein